MAPEPRCPSCNSRWVPAIDYQSVSGRYLVKRECQHCGKEFRQTEDSEPKIELRVEWRKVT